MGKGRAVKRYPGVEARGDSIRIRFNWHGRRSETLRLEPTAANLTHAVQLRGEIRRKIALGTFRYAEFFPTSDHARAEAGDRGNPVKWWSQKWLDSLEVAKSTAEGYLKSLKRHVWPFIGDRPIIGVTELELRAVLKRIGKSGKTRNNTLITIRGTFAAAKLPENPALAVEYVDHQSPLPDPFEPEEAEAILAEMAGRFPEAVNYFGVGFFVGPRPSELIAVKWADLDLRADEWLVKRAKVRREEKDTKTHVARVHKLSSRARTYIEAQRSQTQLRSPYVFLDPVTGNQYNDDKPPRVRYWQPVIKTLGIRYRPPEQMRHTYITMAIMAGANPVWVAKQAGNSPRVIFKHYARWIERAGGDREAAKIEQSLGQNWGNSAGKPGGKVGGGIE